MDSAFGGLELVVDTDVPGGEKSVQEETWSVREDGSLLHGKTGIQIGELGLADGATKFSINQDEIEIDRTALLGRGAGGIVTRAVHIPTNTILAVKVVHVEDKSKRTQLINDLHTLLRIQKSAFLIQLYAAYVHKETGCVNIALEYMDYGSLSDLKRKMQGAWEDKYHSLIMMQILEGLKTLHLSYVVHRDVKLGNILINSRGVVKVTDFGISKKLGDSLEVCDTFVGTATHMSPERVLGEDYSFAADIWSLGLCVYELASGAYPYGSIASFPVLFDNLCNKPEPRLQDRQDASRFTPQICNFVEHCLQRIPLKRKTAIQLQCHEWILDNMFRVTQAEFIVWLHSMRDHTT